MFWKPYLTTIFIDSLSRINPEPNCCNINSGELLHNILIQAVECEAAEAVKHFLRNKLYRIKNQTLKSIICDDSSTYIKSNNIKKQYQVTLEDDNSLSVKKVHQHNDKYFIKEREGRNRNNTLVNNNSMYIVERY